MAIKYPLRCANTANRFVVLVVLLTRLIHAHNDDRSDEQLSKLREALVRSQSLIVYGISNGPALADMQPFHGTASMFLLEVGVHVC